MIHLTFCPIRPRNVFFELELHTEYGDNKCFQIRAIVQQPRVVLKKSVLVPPDLYWNMTSNYQITLINQSAIAAMFEWQQPFGNSSDWVDVQVISSLRGEIAPQSEMQVDLAITPRQLMTIEELFLPCTVENQSDPVLLSVLGRVNDLQVNYTLVSSNDAEDMSHRVTLQENSSIDFGEKVPLHSVQKRVLLLQNSSAIPTTFHIFVEHFSAPKHLEALSPEEIDQLSHLPEALVGKKEVKRETREQNNHCETSLLAKTPNLADSRSKPAHLAHYDFCKRILNECKGAAFYCHPNKGELPPFSCVPVEIAAYNDMWGQYSDNLICAVGHLPPVNFKMSLGVVGCPIEFTMTAGQTDRQPIMRFGCRTAGSDSITRPIRLKNKSPFEIRVDWRIFEMQSNDRKLLDLNVEFGNVFELLDKDGNEVPQGFRLETPPAPPEAESLSRAPSDSLDSESIHNSIPAIVPDDMEDTDLDTFRSDLDIAINFHQANHIFALPQRPKVVHLFIRPHEGHPRKPGVVDDSETQESFTLQPKQLRIPAESYAYLHATFHPIASPHPLTFNCYALGFLSIDNFRAFTPGKVSRGEHYFVEPLRLDLRANIEEPGLEILDDEEEAQDFVLGGSFSELLSTEPVGSGKEGIRITHFLNPNKAITKKCCGIIRNYKETNLSFQLLCPAPFKLLKPRNDSRCRSTRLGEEMDSSGLSQELLIHLKPREICPLEITFDINGTLLPMLQNAPFHDPDQIQPVYWHKKFGNEKELCIRDAITVRFSNNKCQYRSIYAKIAFPTFELTKTKCEFGTCFISQCREMHLEIKNNTTSDCIWSVRRENIIGDDEIIRLEPTNGFLEGYQGALSKNKQLLKVFFTPKSGEFYEVRFIFNGVMGEEPCELIVTGNGSFDGQYHVIYNE